MLSVQAVVPVMSPTVSVEYRLRSLAQSNGATRFTVQFDFRLFEAALAALIPAAAVDLTPAYDGAAIHLRTSEAGWTTDVLTNGE
jgi:hypothetical protein